MDLSECGTCGRKFNPDALARHRPICAKNQKKKPRKAFDAQKNRLLGTEVNYNEIKRKEKMGPSAKEIRAAERKNNWREKHHNLVSTIKAARGETDDYSYNDHSYQNSYQKPSSYNQPSAHKYKENQYERNQYDAPPVRAAAPAQARAPASRIPTQSRVPAGYANCQHCGRNFSEETAERHIPWCEDQQRKKAIKQGSSAKATAAQKMAARTQYKPPKPIKRTSNGTNGVSSGYGQSSGYGPKAAHQRSSPGSGYGQKTLSKSNTNYYGDDLLGGMEKVQPSAGRRAKQSVLSNLNRDRSAGSSNRRQLRKNCADCSTIYPVDWAKYCCECGKKRT